jgi:serine/threonine protein kinase
MTASSTTLDATHVRPKAGAQAGQTQISNTNAKTITATLPAVEWGAHGPQLQERAVERYETLDVLGSGGMGEVVKARDNDIGRTVAVKRLHPDLAQPELFARFVEEVQIVGQLEHPNIPPIHDAGVDTAGYFFVMKHVDGEPLNNIITKLQSGDREALARWTFERRLDVMRKVAEALSYAHSKGVVHRDLKPANIIVGRMGEVFVLDWGIAVRGKQASQSGEVVGTPMYMSPEQALGKTVDARSDVFSLMLTFYELITLRHPFSAITTPREIMEAIVSQDIPKAAFLPSHPHQPTVSADIGWMLDAGLQRDPDKRIPSADAVLQRLDMIASGEVPIQCPITFTRRMQSKMMKFANNHPLAYMATASLALVALVALVVRAI